MLSGAAQENPRADSDQETGMNEPRYLLQHRERWSTDPGKLGWVVGNPTWRLRLEWAGLGQGKQVWRGIQGSDDELNSDQGSRVVKCGTGDRTQSQSDKMNGDYDLAEGKWQDWVFVEVLIMERVAAGGELLWLQHTCLQPHAQREREREMELGGMAAGQWDTGCPLGGVAGADETTRL